MTLWEQIMTTVPSPTRERILAQYTESFPLEVRCYFATLIEEKIFADDSSEHDPIFEQNAVTFLESLLVAINNRLPELDNLAQIRLTEFAKILQQNITYNSVRLYSYLRTCLHNERNILFPNNQLPIASFIPDEEHIQVHNELRSLVTMVNSNGELNKQISLDYEQFALQYHDYTKANIQLDHMKSEEEQKQEIIKRRNAQIEYSFNQILRNILQLESDFEKVLMLTKQVLTKLVSKFLMQWKLNQCLAGNGARFMDTLNMLQELFESLADIIWNTREQIRLAIKTKNQLQPVQPNLRDYLSQRLQDATNLLSTLITSSFVIEKQPPQVMKTNTRFAATVRLLTGSKLNIQMTQPLVKVSIVSETQAQLTQTQNKATDASSGEILNNTGNMEYSQPQKTLTASFRNMQLKKIKRAEKKGTESVMDEKFALLFQTSFNVGHGDLVYTVWALSLPVVVIVHGNQEPQSWATITWDNAFAETARIPFQIPDKVPWLRLAEALNTKFHHATEKSLSEMNLLFLCEKAFKQPIANPGQMEITWSQFCKEPIPDRSFTFWEWFFAIMKLTREHLRNLWKDDRIMGFVHKKQAEEMLMKCQPGTFLLRFSDSELGGVTIAWINESVDGQPQIIMLQPFLAKDFGIRSLADRIQDLHQLTTLYPDIPKDTAFGQYYTPIPISDQSKNGYVKPVLVTQVPGVSGGHMSFPNTPQHYNMQSPDHSRDTPSVTSSFGGQNQGGQASTDMDINETYGTVFAEEFLNDMELLQRNF